MPNDRAPTNSPSAATTSGAADEKLVYQPVFEAFRKGLGARATPTFLAELATFGLNYDKLLPGYPYEVWERCVLAGATLFNTMNQDDAVAEVGRRMASATIAASPVSKTLMPLLKVMGTGRGLKRAYARSSSENYNKVTFGAETPKSLEIHMSYVGRIPHMARGSFSAIGEAIGVTLRAKIARYEFPTVTYLVEWD